MRPGTHFSGLSVSSEDRLDRLGSEEQNNSRRSKKLIFLLLLAIVAAVGGFFIWGVTRLMKNSDEAADPKPHPAPGPASDLCPDFVSIPDDSSWPSTGPDLSLEEATLLVNEGTVAALGKTFDNQFEHLFWAPSMQASSNRSYVVLAQVLANSIEDARNSARELIAKSIFPLQAQEMGGVIGLEIPNTTCSYLVDPWAFVYLLAPKQEIPFFSRTHIELLPTAEQQLPEPDKDSTAVSSKIKSLPTLSTHRNSFHKPKNDNKAISDLELAHSVFAQSDVAKQLRRLGK